MSNDQQEENKIVFWKKHDKQLPTKTSGDNGAYQEFQMYVQDVWDLSEEDSYKCQRSNLRKHKIDVAKCHEKCTMPLHNSDDENHINDKECKSTDCDINSIISQNTKDLQRVLNIDEKVMKCSNQNLVVLKNSQGEEKKIEKFRNILNKASIDLTELSRLSWSGIPVNFRPIVWRLLSGCLPVNLDKRESVLQRKRFDYFDFVKQYFYGNRDKTYQEIYHQIHIDVPRMNSVVNLFQQKIVQEIFERILYIWAIRHPASGYVQGMNDLVTPFFIVFLQEVFDSDGSIENAQLSTLSEIQLNNIEADSFWCLTKLLDGLQDNYIFPQLGIQEKVIQLKELIERIDITLHNHLITNGIDYLQFSFRWMNNLLTRELPLRCTIRIWDTYLAEMEEFSTFQVYVYAAFLIYWRRELLKQTDFQGLMILLQNLPTDHWDNDEIRLIVAEAFKLKSIFANAPKHFQSKQCANTFR